MHDFARERVANPSDPVLHQDFVAAAALREFAPLRLGHVRDRGAVTVACIEHIALRTIKLEPGPGQDVRAHAAHQLLIEVNIV